MGTDEPICRAGIEARYREGTGGHRGKREGGMKGDSNVDMYPTMCEVDS